VKLSPINADEATKAAISADIYHDPDSGIYTLTWVIGGDVVTACSTTFDGLHEEAEKSIAEYNHFCLERINRRKPTRADMGNPQ